MDVCRCIIEPDVVETLILGIVVDDVAVDHHLDNIVGVEP